MTQQTHRFLASLHTVDTPRSLKEGSINLPWAGQISWRTWTWTRKAHSGTLCSKGMWSHKHRVDYTRPPLCCSSPTVKRCLTKPKLTFKPAVRVKTSLEQMPEPVFHKNIFIALKILLKCQQTNYTWLFPSSTCLGSHSAHNSKRCLLHYRLSSPSLELHFLLTTVPQVVQKIWNINLFF